MTIRQPAKLLKIYIGEGYYYKSYPMYEAILAEAKMQGLGGVTIVRGEEGMGHTHTVQNKEDDHNHDMPILMEIVDKEELIEKFIPIASGIMGNHGLIAICDAVIVHKGISVDIPRAKGPDGKDIANS